MVYDGEVENRYYMETLGLSFVPLRNSFLFLLFSSISRSFQFIN